MNKPSRNILISTPNVHTHTHIRARKPINFAKLEVQSIEQHLSQHTHWPRADNECAQLGNFKYTNYSVCVLITVNEKKEVYLARRANRKQKKARTYASREAEKIKRAQRVEGKSNTYTHSERDLERPQTCRLLSGARARNERLRGVPRADEPGIAITIIRGALQREREETVPLSLLPGQFYSSKLKLKGNVLFR